MHRTPEPKCAAQAPHLRYITSDAMRAFFALKAQDATGDALLHQMGKRLT